MTVTMAMTTAMAVSPTRGRHQRLLAWNPGTSCFPPPPQLERLRLLHPLRSTLSQDGAQGRASTTSSPPLPLYYCPPSPSPPPSSCCRCRFCRRNGNPSATVVVFSPRCLSAQDAERIAGRGGIRVRGPVSRTVSGVGDDGQEHQDSFTSADYRDYCAKTSTVLGASEPGGSQSMDVFGTGGTFPHKPDEDDGSDRLSSSKHRGRRKRELLTRRADGDSGTGDSGTRTLSNDMTPTSHTLTSSSDVFDDRLTALGSSAAGDEDDGDGDGVFSGMPSFEDDDFSPKPRAVHAAPTTEETPPPPRGEVSSGSSLEGLCPMPGGYPVPGGGRSAGAPSLTPLGEPAPGNASVIPGQGSVPIVPAPIPPPAAADAAFLSSPTIDVGHGGAQAAVEHEEVKAGDRAAYEDDDIDGTDEEQVDVGLEGDHVFLSADGGHLRSSLSSQLAPGFFEALGDTGFHSDAMIEVGDSGAAAVPAAPAYGFAPPASPSPRHAREKTLEQAFLPGGGDGAASGKGPVSHQEALSAGDPGQGDHAHLHPDTRFAQAFETRGMGVPNHGTGGAPSGGGRGQWGPRAGEGDWGASATAADYKQASDGLEGLDEVGPGGRSAGGDRGLSSRGRGDRGGSGRRQASRSGSGGPGGQQGSSDEEGIGKASASRAAGLSSFLSVESSAVGGGGGGGAMRRGFSRRSGGDSESDSSSADRDCAPVGSNLERVTRGRAQRGLSDDAPRLVPEGVGAVEPARVGVTG